MGHMRLVHFERSGCHANAGTLQPEAAFSGTKDLPGSPRARSRRSTMKGHSGH